MLKLKWLWVLSAMWMAAEVLEFCRGVDLQLLQHLSTESVLRQHASNGAANGIGWLLGQTIGVRRLGQAARVTGVAVEHLLFGLARGQYDLVGALVARQSNLVGVDDDHVVAGVHVRRKRWLVLAAQSQCNFGGQSAQYETVGVYDVPVSFDFVNFW